MQFFFENLEKIVKILTTRAYGSLRCLHIIVKRNFQVKFLELGNFFENRSNDLNSIIGLKIIGVMILKNC